jgi:hypothetical protein
VFIAARKPAGIRGINDTLVGPVRSSKNVVVSHGAVHENLVQAEECLLAGTKFAARFRQPGTGSYATLGY